MVGRHFNVPGRAASGFLGPADGLRFSWIAMNGEPAMAGRHIIWFGHQARNLK